MVWCSLVGSSSSSCGGCSDIHNDGVMCFMCIELLTFSSKSKFIVFIHRGEMRAFAFELIDGTTDCYLK